MKFFVCFVIFSLTTSNICAAENLKVPAFIGSVCLEKDMALCMVELGILGMAVGVIENAELKWSGGFGYREKGTELGVDEHTVFSAGSISKVINAALILRMVAEGRVSLDKDVNRYLETWKIPANRFTEKTPVTLRAILSHSAGFNQKVFPDFLPGEKLPDAIQTLEGLSPAKGDPVRVRFVPLTDTDYSGGGITVSQVLVENVTGLSYEDAARKYVFEPLGMTRSTFINPLPASYGNIAKAHDDTGRITALPRGWEAMPEMAASGLWTSAKDLSVFTAALLKSYREPGGYIPQDLAEDMMTRVLGNNIYGLGPRINDFDQPGTAYFHHGGTSRSYKARIQGHLESGNGFVILINNRNNGKKAIKKIQNSFEKTYFNKRSKGDCFLGFLCF